MHRFGGARSGVNRGKDAVGRQRLPFNEEDEVVQTAILISL
jgi:hypothetical protein